MHHLSLRSSGETSTCLLFGWNTLVLALSASPISNVFSLSGVLLSVCFLRSTELKILSDVIKLLICLMLTLLIILLLVDAMSKTTFVESLSIDSLLCCYQ